MNARDRSGDESDPPAPHVVREDSDVPAPRLARIVLLAALAGYSLITVLNIINEDLPPAGLVVALAGLAGVLALQVAHSAPGARHAPPLRRALTLTLQAALTYGPLALFHTAWGAMGGFLAGSVLLLLPGRAAWPLYGMIGLSMFSYSLLGDRSLLDSAYLAESTLVTGLVVFGLSSLTGLVNRLHANRAELARLAVAGERLRFSRDLHDLLGYNLSAITLRTELIRRLAPDLPERAREEVESVLCLSRQSLADVRKVATGYRDMSLRQEAEVTRSMLEAAEIKVETHIAVGPLAPEVDTVLATVLREGVTNALRHSHVRQCHIRATEKDGMVTLSLGNDGVTTGDDAPGPYGDGASGSGLHNLAHRLTRIGGSLTTELGDDGWFRTTARVPAGP